MISLNVQGMSRRSESLMNCIVATPGYVLVSSDLGSGEPTVLTHYSKDDNYTLASFVMKGQAPFYNKQGMLIIDDIYLMVASKFPRWELDIWNAFNATYEGMTFAEKWLSDSDHIAKKVLKHIRPIAKAMILGLSYGMGPKKLVLTARQAGYNMTLNEAREFFKLYWKTFPKVKKLSEKLEVMYDSLGHLQNDFGYVLYPSAGYKCLNAFIQSTVAGIMAYLTKLYFEPNPWIRFVTQIHDEFIFEIPEDRVKEAKELYDQAIVQLNSDIGWDIVLYFGWVEGKTWLEAK